MVAPVGDEHSEKGVQSSHVTDCNTRKTVWEFSPFARFVSFCKNNKLQSFVLFRDTKNNSQKITKETKRALRIYLDWLIKA